MMVAMGNERDVDVPFIGESKLDDAVVVQIDTGERTKRLRIVLNEAVVYDGDPEITQLDLGSIFHKLSRFEADAKQLSLDIGDLRGSVAHQVERSPGVKL